MATLLGPLEERLHRACGVDSLRILWPDLPRLEAALAGAESLRLSGAALDGGRLSVTLAARVRGRTTSVLLGGEAQRRADQWSATRFLPRGEVLRAGDLERRRAWMPAFAGQSIPNLLAPDPSRGLEGAPTAAPSLPPGRLDWIGSCPVRAIARGEAVDTSDLGPPPLVRGGERLRVLWRGPGLAVEAAGIARQDGWLGSTIPLRIDGARRDCEGVVTGAGEVRVRPAEEAR